MSSNSNDNNSEQQFTIQPHPAKTNDPADLQSSGGLQTSQGAFSAFQAQPGPQIPSSAQLAGLQQPLSHEELQKRQAELNKDN